MNDQMKVTFKDYFFDQFEQWEDTQANRRSNFSAFARWLSDNSFNIEIKQQNVDTWMKGVIPKEEKYLVVLAEKLGDDIYNIVKRKKVNVYLFRLNQRWEFVPEEIQKKLSEEAMKYETQNISKRVQKFSKRRKASSNK